MAGKSIERDAFKKAANKPESTCKNLRLINTLRHNGIDLSEISVSLRVLVTPCLLYGGELS